MTLTKEQSDYIIDLYVLSEHNTQKAIELFNNKFGFIISRANVGRKWREEGFELNPLGGPRNGLDEEQFKEIYNLHEGNIKDIAKTIGVQENSVIVRCKKLGLEIKVHKNSYSIRNAVENKYYKIYSIPSSGKVNY